MRLIPTKPWSLIFVGLAISMLVGVFLFGYVQQIQKVRNLLSEELNGQKLELSQALANHGWLEVAAIGRSLVLPQLTAMGIKAQGRIVFSAPTEESFDRCKPDFKEKIRLYGVEVGSVEACINFRSNVLEVLRSPSLILLAIMIMSLSVLGSIAYLLQYRQGLTMFMDLLSKKLEEHGREMTPIEPGSDDIPKKMIDLVNQLVDRQTNLQKEIDELERDRELNQQAVHIAHDIRSPLSALRMVAKTLGNTSGPQSALMAKAVERIDGIADQLLKNAKRRSDMGNNCEILTALQDLVAEKKIEFVDRANVELHIAGIDRETRIPINQISTKRIFSNLINNAVESYGGERASVGITLQRIDNLIRITLADSGKGIPMEIIEKIGERGYSFGKEDGNGLGIFWAKETLSNAGGRLEIQSTYGVGTKVSVELPTVGRAP